MSMNRCFKCGDIYDTDYQMEEIDDEMVCDNCYDEMKQREKCEEDLIHEIMDSEMWKETKVFDVSTPVFEILEWARKAQGFRNNLIQPELFKGCLEISIAQ